MTEQETPSYSVYISGGITPLNRELTRQLVAAGHRVAVQVTGSVEANTLRTDGGLPVYGDADDTAALANDLKMLEANVVLNLAPLAFNVPPTTRRDWKAAAERLNIESGALLGAAQAAKVAQFVHASYSFLYADSDEPVAEDAADRAAHGDPFLKSALHIEKAVEAAEGCVVRAGYAFSGGETDALRDVHQMMKRTLVPTYVGQPSSTANWVHTDDLAAAVVAIINKQAKGKFNIASNTPLSTYDFLALFGGKLGLSVPSNVPAFMAATTVGKTQATLLDAKVALNTDHAKAELDWQPKFPSVETALDDILLTWRATV